MAKLSWKKALIEKAHTFMDYVVGWRGFYTTENVATKQASNTWVVPQKLTEVPQQTQTGYFDTWYNLPYMVGFSSSDLRYRYPANNQGYEFLKNFNENQQQSNQVVKVDYRNNSAMKWGSTNAGVGITGVFRNYAPATQDLLKFDTSGDTFWRILYSSQSTSYNIKPVCDDGVSNIWQEVVTNVNTQRTPFIQGTQGSWGADFKNNTIYQKYFSQRIGRVFDKFSNSRDRTQVISFYVWTGFLNEEWIRKGQPTRETISPCGGTANTVLQKDVSRLTVPSLAFWFQNTNERSNVDWYQKDINYNRTCLTINLLNRSHTVAYESNDGDTISNAEFIDNVQFESCPYDYTRVKIFLRPNPKNETTTGTGTTFGRYTKMEVYSADLQANAQDILNYSIQRNYDYPSLYFNTPSFYTIYGLMQELSSYQFNRYTDYVTGDYKTLRLFQEWINFMNPLYTASSSIEERSTREEAKPFGYPKSVSKNQFQRLRYPDEYKRSLSITKFERNIGNTGSIKTYRGTQIPEVDPVFTPEKSFTPDAISYQFINAFPTSIQDIALTYQASTVLQVTVEFAYDRYVIVQNARRKGYEKANVPVKDDTKITVSDEVDKS